MTTMIEALKHQTSPEIKALHRVCSPSVSYPPLRLVPRYLGLHVSLAITQVPLLYYLQVYKYYSCVLNSLSLNITFTLPSPLLYPPGATRSNCNFASHLAHCALPSDFGSSRLPTSGTPSDFHPPYPRLFGFASTFAYLVSLSCQSLVQPTCDSQVVNLPVGLDFFVLPLAARLDSSEYVCDRSQIKSNWIYSVMTIESIC